MKADLELKKMIPLLLSVVIILAVALFIVFGGGSSSNKKNDKVKVTKKPAATVAGQKYDSSCEGMITRVDIENSEIGIYDFKFENTMIFSYSGGTHFTDKYDGALSEKQLYPGMIVNVDYITQGFKLVNLKEHKGAWEYKKLKNYSYNEAKDLFVINKQDYKVTDDVLVVSSNTLYALSDIGAGDVLTVRGIDNMVWSIEITKGHGYLSLKGEEELIGGVMTIDDKNYTITEGMRVTLGEGNYTIKFAKGKLNGEKRVLISRFNSTVLDVSDIFEAPKGSSQVTFNISPEKAVLYIDDEQRSYGVPVVLEYGTYKIKVVKDGYNTYMGSIQVDDAGETITVNLTKVDTSDDESKDDDEDDEDNDVEPTSSPSPTKTPKPEATEEPEDTEEPENTESPTKTPKPTDSPKPSSTSKPTSAPRVTPPTVEVPTVDVPDKVVPEATVPDRPTV